MTFHLPMLTSAYPGGVCFGHLLRLSSPNNGPGEWMRLGRVGCERALLSRVVMQGRSMKASASKLEAAFMVP